MSRILGILLMFMIGIFFTRAADETLRDKVDRLEIIAKEKPNDKNTLKELGYLYLNLGNYEQAAQIGERLLEIGEKTGDVDFARLYGLIFINSGFNGNSSESQAYRSMEEALVIAEHISDYEALVSIYNSFAIYYSRIIDDIYTALYYYFKALDFANAIGDQRRYAIILSNIASCYTMRNDPTGLKYAEEAYETAVRLKEVVPQFYSAYSLAYLYIMGGHYAKALEYIKIVERLQDEINYADPAEIHTLYCTYYLDKGENDKAIEEILKAINCGYEVPITSMHNRQRTYATALRQAGRAAQAIEVLDSLYNNPIGGHIGNDRGEIMKEYSLSYRELGKPDLALVWALRYQNFTDSVLDIDRERALRETRINHEIFMRDKKLDRQKLELMTTRYRLIIFTVLTVLLVALIISMMIFYSHKKRLYAAIVRQNEDALKREKYLMDQLEQRNQRRADSNSGKSQPQLDESRSDDIMNRVTKLMLEDKIFTNGNLTLVSLAEMLDTNRTYLSNAINQSTGKSFSQYVNSYRIAEAIRLISNTEANMPLKQVAAQCGFNSLSTFYSAFQSIVGMTPARYCENL